MQYTELEAKIPGLKVDADGRGMYMSPADGEWKKVRSLMMIKMSGY